MKPFNLKYFVTHNSPLRAKGSGLDLSMYVFPRLLVVVNDVSQLYLKRYAVAQLTWTGSDLTAGNTVQMSPEGAEICLASSLC